MTIATYKSGIQHEFVYVYVEVLIQLSKPKSLFSEASTNIYMRIATCKPEIEHVLVHVYVEVQIQLRKPKSLFSEASTRIYENSRM